MSAWLLRLSRLIPLLIICTLPDTLSFATVQDFRGAHRSVPQSAKSPSDVVDSPDFPRQSSQLSPRQISGLNETTNSTAVSLTMSGWIKKIPPFDYNITDAHPSGSYTSRKSFFHFLLNLQRYYLNPVVHDTSDPSKTSWPERQFLYVDRLSRPGMMIDVVPEHRGHIFGKANRFSVEEMKGLVEALEDYAEGFRGSLLPDLRVQTTKTTDGRARITSRGRIFAIWNAGEGIIGSNTTEATVEHRGEDGETDTPS